MFHKILIANRGEIAARIIRSAQEAGIRTVAVYASDDLESLHVKQSDEAVLLKGDTLSQTYLNQQRLIEIAVEHGAEAIHPGYGFLAENADFAEKVMEAGLVFIGPKPEHIRLMGEKTRALDYVRELGVSTPGSYHGTAEELAGMADTLDFPVIVKASAGGGGKGMFVCYTPEELLQSLPKAGRQALEYFGNGDLFVEKYLPKARHVEVQVAGDTQGNVLHFYERECSVQRRFQKIIEEAPSPFVSDELRQELTAAAVKIARSMSYWGLGTIEFLLDDSGQFYFLEMNTRIQVEHPVTEMITGIDLVSLQLTIAAGQPLPFAQNDIQISGHAIEARVCAEDPENQFRPSAGVIPHFYFPEKKYIRTETFLSNGIYVSPGYDSLLAKLIVWGTDRKEALERMQQVVDESVLLGVRTNVSFLSEILSGNDFANSRIYTRWVDEKLEQINRQIKARKDHIEPEMLALSYLCYHFFRKKEHGSVWEQIGYWRFLSDMQITVDNVPVSCLLIRNMNETVVQINEKSFPLPVFSVDDHWMNIRFAQQNVRFYCFEDSYNTYMHHEGFTFALWSNQILKEARVDREKPVTEKVFQNRISSDLFGKVLSLKIKPGDRVQEGQALITIESMKSEFHVLSPAEARVKEIYVAEGNMVQDKQVLVELEPNK